ncbi:MAG TPA: RNA polymerase sigma factor [Steroidobacteraceae bacterium]|nr:RNA polymerase sigma factor [Steroidobacteraceae bacterium]
MEEQADAQLMLRYAAGDVRAFEELYERNRRPLWRFIKRLAGDAAATDDVFQECWSRVIGGRARYRPTARFRTWLYRIAYNCCMDHWRRSGRRAGHETVDDDAITAAADSESSNPLEIAVASEKSGRLNAALLRLPDEQRLAFLLYVEGGLTVAEIAQETGTGAETAKSRLRYAVTHLKEMLGADAPAD